MNLSIVIPAFNEGQRLPATLTALVHTGLKPYLDRGHTFEIIVVEDGSRASDIRLVEERIVELKPLSLGVQWHHITQTPNQGKGAALDRGFRAAQGDWVGFLDADGSTAAESVSEIISKIFESTTIDAFIGSRILMLGRKVRRHARRHYVGRVFATLFYLMFHIPVYDSQCGCKFFRRSLALSQLDRILDRRWVWDTQLLVLCYKAGAKMIEVPVEWQEFGGSHVSMLRDPYRMLKSLFIFRMRLGFSRSRTTT